MLKRCSKPAGWLAAAPLALLAAPLAVMLAAAPLAVMLAVRPALAAVPPWPDSAFSYYAQNETLGAVLRNFASSVNTPLVLSPKIDSRQNLEGARFAPSPRAFLDQLSEEFHLIWYYDGAELYLYRSDETIRQAVKARREGAALLRKRILASESWDSRFGLTFGAQEDTLIIEGPPRFVELIETEARLPYAVSGGKSTRLFALRYAWAEDKTFYYRDREIVAPGVVTLLRRIFNLQPDKAGGGRRGLPGPRGVLGENKARQTPPQQETVAAQQPDDGAPGIGADPRLNAVIIHADDDSMAMYEDLIRQLDAPSGLVEIQAAVFDVGAEEIERLGIAWRHAGSDFAVGYGALEADIDEGQFGFELGDGVNFSTLLASGARQFISRIDALQRDGKANVLARPSVLTMDNFEALIDIHQTFHVRVEGHEAVDLFPVTTGALMRVTPHIVKGENGRRGVQMAISIEDGAILNQEVDNIPVIQNNTINTQAFVGENESLLIGGYYTENESDTVDDVPILGSIPLLNLLFRHKQRRYRRNERIYMITPTILPLPTAAGQPG